MRHRNDIARWLLDPRAYRLRYERVSVSSATLVPETRDLSGDDAWEVLKRIGWGRLAKDAFKRLRVADGFSHARSLAFMIALVAVEGLIGIVGLASVLHKGQVSTMIDAAIRRTIPGPAGHVLTTAVTQAHRVAAGHHYGALLFGVLSALVVGTAAMGQLERGLNRIYGVEQDRSTLKKYGLGFFFALSVGTLVAAAFVCLAFGRDLFFSIHNHALTSVWSVVRWPLGVGLIAIAVTVLFRWSPRRRQPRLSWLAFGSGMAVFLWGLSTIGLGLFYGSSSSFGETYGPLAGVIALLVWSLLSSISMFYGAAVAAQLEALRTGEPTPQDAQKVVDSDPASDPSGEAVARDR
jgi:YihY family inner membrane protein